MEPVITVVIPVCNCYMIPGVRRAVNYLYNRFYRKMQPIKQ